MTNSATKRADRKHPWLRRILVAVLVLVVCAMAAMFVYLLTYSHADATALEAMSVNSDDGVQVMPQSGMVVFRPTGTTAPTGFIFYPGGKVDRDAYAPVMRRIAQRGHLVVLLDVPFHLAIFETDAADRAIAAVPGIETWVFGGHSLGGVAAAMHAKAMLTTPVSPDKDAAASGGDKPAPSVVGLVLMASYPTNDMADLPLAVLSLRGTKDGLVTPDKWAKYNPFLPAAARLAELPGGNHAQFGSYGPQKGDEAADVTAQVQWDWVSDEVTAFLSKLDE